MQKMFLVCVNIESEYEGVDLGYHVYAVCSSKTMADNLIDDSLELRPDYRLYVAEFPLDQPTDLHIW